MKRFALALVLALVSVAAFAQWSVDAHPLSTFLGLSSGIIVKGGAEYEYSDKIVISARPGVGLITGGGLFGGEVGGEYYFSGTPHEGLFAGAGLGGYVVTFHFDSVYIDSVTFVEIIAYLEVGYGWVFDRVKLGASGMLQQTIGGSLGIGLDGYVGWRL